MPDEPRVTVLLAQRADDPGRPALAAALRRAGWQVRLAHTGEDVLRLAADRPDLILLDDRLSDAGATEVRYQLKADPATACIPVFLMNPMVTFDERLAPELAADSDNGPATSREAPRLRRGREQPEEHLRRLLEASSEGVVSVDRDGTIVFANRAAAELLGYAAADVPGRDFHTLVHDRPGGGSPCAGRDCIVRLALERGRPIRVADELFSRREGSDMAVEFRAGPIPGGGTVITFRDVTEHKRLEDRFRQSQKMEPVGRLASGVTHDFNNLLTIISGYCEILLSRLDPQDPSREMIVEIKRAEERAAGLTRQLLAISRKQVVEPKLLDLNAVIGDMSKLLRRLIGEDIDIVTLPGADLGGIRADLGQIEQVLLNLAVNARDAMPHGGRMFLKTANVVVGEDFARRQPGLSPGRYVQLSVTDTGCGMNEEVRAHLFEPFYTTKEKGKGTGLGLSTVYGIVKQWSGHITVDSEPRRGSTFRIYLPRAADTPAADGPPGSSESYPGSETVLLTEDDPVVGELIAKVLTPLGYTVLPARNAGEALQICAEYGEPIHLLLCDVVLPQMTGRELARRLTALRPELRVLFISGYSNGVAPQPGAADAEAVLAKPFSTEALARKVREVLDGALMPR